MRNYFLALIVSVLLPMGLQAKVKGYYRVSLSTVDVVGEKGVISNPENAQGFTTPVYEDDVMAIAFNFEPTHIDFTLSNKSDQTLKILWDEAIYVGGPSGVSVGVFHSGVKLIDRSAPQTPTVVVRGSKINDLLVTKDGVSFNGTFGRWVYSYILYWEDALKQVKVLLPIEVNGEKREYLFDFAVNWENIKVKTRIYDGREYYIEKK